MIGCISLSLNVWSTVLNSTQLDGRLPSLGDVLIVRGADRDPPRLLPPGHGLAVKVFDDATIDLQALLDRMTSRVEPLVPAIVGLRREDPELEIIFHVNFTPLHSRIGIFFEPRELAWIAAIKARVSVDFFETAFVGEDDRYAPFTPDGWPEAETQGG